MAGSVEEKSAGAGEAGHFGKDVRSDLHVAIEPQDGGGLDIACEVSRRNFERWIAPDVARIEASVDQVLAKAERTSGEIDRVFLTGGSSLQWAVSASSSASGISRVVMTRLQR